MHVCVSVCVCVHVYTSDINPLYVGGVSSRYVAKGMASYTEKDTIK